MRFWFLVVVVGCGDDSIAVDAGSSVDAASDASLRDASSRDAGADPDGGGDDAGSDSGAPDAGGCAMDCDALDDACSDWSCDGATAECTSTPRADGTACDDGDACTMLDACVAGECEGSAIDCSGSGDACNAGECDPATGTCIATPLPDGTTCDDGDLCSTGDSCRAGSCAGAGLDCSGLTDMCNTGRCNPSTGTCIALPLADGTRCDDGARCTSTDFCRSGACRGTAVDCSPMADMCNSAMCNPATGACVRTPVTPGATCDDGLRCTTTDTCNAAGLCGGIATDCSMSGDMCNTAMCDPATGGCARTPVPDGTLCNDGNACTTERCAGGSCVSTLTCRAPLRVLSFGTLTDTTMRGGAGGVLTEDACPITTALVGVTGELNPGGWIGRLRGLCGNLRLTGSGAGPYTIDLPSVGSMTALRGVTGGAGTTTSMCPPNTVVVGFTGRAGGFVDQLALRCAPLIVSSTPTEFVVNVGAVSTAPPAGGTGGTAFPNTDCPAGQIASEVRIRSLDSIDAFGVGCVVPRLTYPITMSARTPTATQGGGGGVAFADACPAGTTIDLYDGFLDMGWHGQIRAQCPRYEVVGPVAAPSGVASTSGGTTPYRGTSGTGSWIRSCTSVDRQAVMVGFEGRSGSLIDQVTFHCARLVPMAGGTFSLGAPFSIAAVGGAGGTPFPLTTCPAGMIATEARGRAFLAVDAIGMGCSTPTW